MIIKHKNNIILTLNHTPSINGSIITHREWQENRYWLRSLLLLAIYKDFLKRTQKLLSPISEIDMNIAHDKIITVISKLNPIKLEGLESSLKDYLLNMEKQVEFKGKIMEYYNLNIVHTKHNTVPKMLRDIMSRFRIKI